ncbi:glycolate oxidase [Elusimicrobium posterum]|uniref:FAD-binding oxidoreductase n=1 Tax=Elusimicrobium posterum TaxID=3116653 RepID=UPI003C750F90
MFTTNKFKAARKEVEDLLGKNAVITDKVTIALNSFDCSLNRTNPDAVLEITDAAPLASLIKILNKHKVPFVPRAAATNHCGCCVALKGGVVLNLMPLNKILKIDTAAGIVEAQPSVITAELQAALDPLGYSYAPDPASQKICTLAGNAALNAGGAKGLKYGNTLMHVMAADFITAQGDELHLDINDGGPNLLGLMIGAEGTLGVMTKLYLKIEPKIKFIKTVLVAFDSIEDAVKAVAEITAAGIVPRCVEAMDKITTRAIEMHMKSGYPTDCEALLLIETDGALKKAEDEIKKIEEICQKCGSLKTIVAKTEEERQKLWQGRQAGYAAMAGLAPNVFVEDGTVPRARLPQAIKKTREICEKYNVTAGLFFHAGDGNLHPNIVFDERNRYETKFVVAAGKEIMQACVDEGGTISGEHGIGVEKRGAMSFMYSEREIELFHKIKKVFDPLGICNPDKVIPVSSRKEFKEDVLSAEEKELVDVLQQEKTVYVTGLNTLKAENDLPKAETKKLNKILDIDKANYTATVQTGASVKEVNKQLAAQKVFAALPSYKGSLGGLFAQGLSVKFLNSITGVKVMMADGSIINYGGKFVKNSAGYNLTRLFSGSMGKYGIVLEITFRLYTEDQKADLTNPKTYKEEKYQKDLKQLLDFENKFF